jgi:ketosteroid isomerase-like protein
MRLCCLLVIIACVSAPLAAKEPMPAVPSFTWVQDLEHKRIDHLMGLYTRDAVFVEPGGKTYTGLAEIRALNVKVMATYDSDLHLHAKSLSQNGPTAVDTGDWTETLRDRSTHKAMHLHGGYRFTAQHQPDGRWLFSRMEWTLVTP